jgi:copper chaperone
MSGERAMQTIEIKVTGMSCSGCERTLQTALMQARGVTAVKADRRAQSVSVEFDPAATDRQALQQAVEKAIVVAGFAVGG